MSVPETGGGEGEEAKGGGGEECVLYSGGLIDTATPAHFDLPLTPLALWTSCSQLIATPSPFAPHHHHPSFLPHAST